MSDIKVSDLLGDLSAVKYNAAGLFRKSVDVLETIHDGGIQLVDAGNPLVHMLESTAYASSTAISHMESCLRRLYPANATTMSDLYLHMSDKDYIDRFAKPSTATFIFQMPRDVLVSKMVTDPISGVKKLIIPRNTMVTVAGVTFSLQYPIQIRQLSHGGLQLVYLNDQISPLQELASNEITWSEFVDNRKITWVRFSALLTQFKITTVYNPISSSSGLKTDVTLTDQFYYVRVYHQVNGKWTEIVTTHSTEVYDPAELTAIIRVLENSVRVIIPVTYVSQGMISGKIRVDVYETKGYLRMLLENFSLEEYVAQWYNVDATQDDVYNVAIRKVTDLLIMSTTAIDEGRDSLSFEELKARVISNSIGLQKQPMTQDQLRARLEDLGYTLVRNIDTITNRIFQASRELPDPTDANIATRATYGLTKINLSLADAALAHGSYDSGDMVTLSSDVIYREDNGIISVMSESDYQNMLLLSAPQLCNFINRGSYFYSPFTYVLDASQGIFAVRAYDLDSPDVVMRNFIGENETTQLQVNISSAYELRKHSGGFYLYLETSSSAEFKALEDSDIFVQMSLTSPNQVQRVYVTGELINKTDEGERTYRFALDSKFKVDAEGYLELTSLYNPDNGLPVKCALSQKVSVVFSTIAQMPMGYAISEIDELINQDLIPVGVASRAISLETLQLSFGQSLDALWKEHRSIVSEALYETYATNIPAVYPQDVYAADPLTGETIFFDEQGNLIYNLQHSAGDYVYDNLGNQQFAHRIGDLKLDENGNAILIASAERRMQRVVDILTLPAAYALTTSDIFISYRQSILSNLRDWILVDMPTFQDLLLEQTKLFFTPKETTGYVRVIDNDNQRTLIKAEQSLAIALVVLPKVYADSALLDRIKTVTIQTVESYLANTTVSKSGLEAALTQAYGNDVISISTSGLGGYLTDVCLTMLDDNNRLSLKKRLSHLGDGTLIVEEDINIRFISHGLSV